MGKILHIDGTPGCGRELKVNKTPHEVMAKLSAIMDKESRHVKHLPTTFPCQQDSQKRRYSFNSLSLFHRFLIEIEMSI
ncbi:hypothetical protein WG904_01820 [Pedobacter sp. Du54]|uniref:hypothetical protein n=1 Tax=Pedobacter anseongensis TaxID=3133439 RepID=UPI0030B47931